MPRRSIPPFAALALAVLVPALARAAQEPAGDDAPAPAVRLRAERGRERALDYRVEHENTTRALGQTGGYALRLDARCRFGPEGGAVRFDGAAVTFSTGDERVHFDSREPAAARPADAPARAVVEGIVGDEVAFELDEAGRVAAVRGAEGLLTPSAARLTTHLDAEGLQRTLDTVLAPSPEPAPLAVGEGWTVERANPLSPRSTLILATRYEVAELTAARARLRITGSGRMKHEGTPDGRMAWPEVSAARIRGSLEWNRELGVLERYELVLEMELRGMVPGRAEEVLSVHQVSRARRLDEPPGPSPTPADAPEPGPQPEGGGR